MNAPSPLLTSLQSRLGGILVDCLTEQGFTISSDWQRNLVACKPQRGCIAGVTMGVLADKLPGFQHDANSMLTTAFETVAKLHVGTFGLAGDTEINFTTYAQVVASGQNDENKPRRYILMTRSLKVGAYMNGTSPLPPSAHHA